MNDKDKPANPFGRVERTIIRPNPGGRLPQAPEAHSPSADAGRARRVPRIRRRLPRKPASAFAQCRLCPSPAVAAGLCPAAERSRRRTHGCRPRRTTGRLGVDAEGRASAAAVMTPAEPMLRVDELVAPNANPIMRAAGPLLQLLGRLRVALMRASFASLMEQVADAVKFFETDIRSAGISEHQANTAKYILCATADDIVQHIPTEERHVWTQYSMLSRFFGERVGGVRFFEILDHLKTDPLVNYPVLELQHACLALGFQGMHRASPNGLASLQMIQRNLYETLAPGSAEIQRRSVAALARPGARQPPAARAGAGVDGRGGRRGAADGGLFHAADAAVMADAENAAEVALALHPGDPIELKRRVIAPPPPPPPPPPPDRITQLQRIRNALAAEKTACAMTADQTGELHHHPGLRSRPVRVRTGDSARRLQAGRGARRRDAGQGAGAHQDRGPYRQFADPHRAFPFQFRTLGRARQGGRSRAQAGPGRSEPRRRRRQGPGCADRQQHDAGRTRQEPARRNLYRTQRIADRRRIQAACSPKQIIRIILVGVGLGSLAAVIYFAGPFIAFGDWHPLENHDRSQTSSFCCSPRASRQSPASVSSSGARAPSRSPMASAVREQTVNDEPVLKERMKDALATLKTASGNKSGYLYDLPWYVIIGPPGAGKTTALVNSGLKFPLARGATPAAIAGVGGTRYCDWWFTEEAVLIDTAGRYTTQDSDAKSDKESWFSFLDLLKKSRPRQPINGVLVAISVEDMLTLSRQELAAHAEAIRMRLLELHRAAQGQFSGLCAVHQGRSGRRLHRVFQLSQRGRAGVRSGARRSRPPTRTRT